MTTRRLLIVGGVAGGASCAARARRLSEEAEIVIFDRGSHVSFANCGLPYYIGNIITDEKKLIVATPELFKKRFNIDVRLESNVLAIDRDKREIMVKDLLTGRIYSERYDALLLSTGASPLKPALPGIHLPGIFTLRTIPNSRQIKEWIVDRRVKHAIIVGGGFLGLEMAENLIERGISVTILEMLPQLMLSLDPEMAFPIQQHLATKGVSFHLGDPVTGFAQNQDGTISVSAGSGDTHTADMVILAIGVRPEVSIARDAGLETGEYGGIRVDDQMRTTDRQIWAVGDVVEVQDLITGEWRLAPLAGLANRQGRIAADSIFDRKTKFRGAQSTSVCAAFGLTIASTGANEKSLRRASILYEKVYSHQGHHAGYYPGARPIAMKLLFSPIDGLILGAQAVGEEGVEKRIDIISMAIQKGATVFDLEEAELCYAPQFGAAKDPVNILGMIAVNSLRGDAPIAHWEEIYRTSALILDVRDRTEFDAGHFDGALHIPLLELRARLSELPNNRDIWVYCGVGQRAYYATRLLRLNGFEARNLSGGFRTYNAIKPFIADKRSAPEPEQKLSAISG
jgi:NADPH-dependent 2,4-dienoyl-CoA reductase/sulfur reductase-like enzyme/rhodanese-related sulfurtransferase